MDEYLETALDYFFKNFKIFEILQNLINSFKIGLLLKMTLAADFGRFPLFGIKHVSDFKTEKWGKDVRIEMI